MNNATIKRQKRLRLTLQTWKVVSMASMMLSKLVMPLLGPDHFSRQTDSFCL